MAVPCRRRLIWALSLSQRLCPWTARLLLPRSWRSSQWHLCTSRAASPTLTPTCSVSTKDHGVERSRIFGPYCVAGWLPSHWQAILRFECVHETNKKRGQCDLRSCVGGFGLRVHIASNPGGPLSCQLHPTSVQLCLSVLALAFYYGSETSFLIKSHLTVSTQACLYVIGKKNGQTICELHPFALPSRRCHRLNCHPNHLSDVCSEAHMIYMLYQYCFCAKCKIPFH